MNPDKNRLIRLAKLDDGSPISVGGLPMTDKLKFTDSIRNGIVDALREYYWTESEYQRNVQALNALIECAEAIIKDADRPRAYTGNFYNSKLVDVWLIDKLRGLLE